MDLRRITEQQKKEEFLYYFRKYILSPLKVPDRINVIDVSNCIKKYILSPLKLLPDQINIVHVLLLSMLLAWWAILFQSGGVLHPEIAYHLPLYLSDRGLMNKLYDSKIFDLGAFRARELSYFFDFIDSKCVAFSVSMGHPHFISLTHYLFSILIGLIIWQFSVRELNLKPLIGAGIVVLFWTSPYVFITPLFRSAKIGVALTVALLFFIIFHILRRDLRSKEYRLPLTALLLCFGVAWCATLFDEQGFFLVLTIIAFLSLWIIAFPSKNVLKLLLAFSVCIIFTFVYKFQIVPILTDHFNHYWPDLAFQHMDIRQLITHLHFYDNGVRLLLETLRFLIGNISYLAMALLVVIPFILMLFEMIMAAIDKKNIKLFAVVVTGFVMIYAFICLMLAIMVYKVPAVIWPDIRRIYYWLPILPILCMTIAFVLSRVSKYIPQWVFLVLIIFAIAGNKAAIPVHKAFLLNGHLQPDYKNNTKMIIALKNIKDDHYKPPKDVEMNPLYKYFKKTLGPVGKIKA